MRMDEAVYLANKRKARGDGFYTVGVHRFVFLPKILKVLQLKEKGMLWSTISAHFLANNVLQLLRLWLDSYSSWESRLRSSRVKNMSGHFGSLIVQTEAYV